MKRTTDERYRDESLLSVVLDITKRHPLIFLLLFLFPLLALLASAAMKWHYLFADTAHYLRNYTNESTGVNSDPRPYVSPGVDRYIRELDVAGMLGGIVDIFIGLYITVTAERITRQKDRINQQDMDRIKTQTGLLVEATGSLNALMLDVSGKVSEKVQLMDGTDDVLIGVTKVIESARSLGNHLLVLSNTARIGALAPFRVDDVARHAHFTMHELQQASAGTFREHADAVRSAGEDADRRLRSVAASLRSRGVDARVHVVTLNDQLQATVAQPFLRFLGKVFNEHASVHGYGADDSAPLPLAPGRPLHRQFLIPSATPLSPDQAEDALVTQLVEEQGTAIREMQALGISVTTLAKTVPVQLFISAPTEHATGPNKGLCVCVLGSGSSTSERSVRLTAFLTDDPHIVSSMTDLFHDYETDAQQLTREFIRPVLT